MTSKNKKILLLSILIAVILVAVVLALLLRKNPEPQGTQDTTAPTVIDPTDPSQTDPTDAPTDPTVDPTQPTEEPPPSVTIPPVTEPSGELLGIEFPCRVPGYDVVIQRLESYSGLFVEDGSNVQVEGVAMLQLRNEGDQAIEYMQIAVEYDNITLIFDVSALPAGAGAVVQEKTGKGVVDGMPQSCSALVVRRAQMEMSEDQVSVVDNGDNTLTITNLTDQVIPTIRVFYKYYMEDTKLYVGGIAFTVRITRLAGGSSVIIQPSHYASSTCQVVMVLTYDTDA